MSVEEEESDVGGAVGEVDGGEVSAVVAVGDVADDIVVVVEADERSDVNVDDEDIEFGVEIGADSVGWEDESDDDVSTAVEDDAIKYSTTSRNRRVGRVRRGRRQ